MSHTFKPPFFIVPNSLTKQAGGTAIGSVTDVQTFNDGNVYQVPEVAATPGWEIDFDFTGVKKIYGIVSMIRYDGSATHQVTLRIRNYTGATDDILMQIPSSGALYQYRTILLPPDGDFMDGSNNAQLILTHDSAGNASHNVYVDYIALLGRKI